MLNVFETDDGMFHQAVLSLNKVVLIRLVVEKLALRSDSAAEWEWMVWRTVGLWDGEMLPVSGRETSLSTAKRQAFNTGISMLADLMGNPAASLPALFAMQLHEHWRAGAAIEQH